MAGICNTCKYFRADAHTGAEEKHHCDFQNVALTEAQSKEQCGECIPRAPKSKGCCH